MKGQGSLCWKLGRHCHFGSNGLIYIFSFILLYTFLFCCCCCCFCLVLFFGRNSLIFIFILFFFSFFSFFFLCFIFYFYLFTFLDWRWWATILKFNDKVRIYTVTWTGYLLKITIAQVKTMLFSLSCITIFQKALLNWKKTLSWKAT